MHGQNHIEFPVEVAGGFEQSLESLLITSADQTAHRGQINHAAIQEIAPDRSKP